LYEGGQGISYISTAKGSIIVDKTIIVEGFIPKVIMSVTLMPKVSAMVLVLLLICAPCDVAQLLDQSASEAQRAESSSLLFFNLLHDGFEVVDLPIKHTILWCRADGLPLLVPCLSKEFFLSLVGIQRSEDNIGCCRLLQRHDEACRGPCEFTGGGRQC
jgi:hypothetical protein